MEVILDEVLDIFPDKVQINLDELKEFIKGGQFPQSIITTIRNDNPYRVNPLIVLWFNNPIYNLCNFCKR